MVSALVHDFINTVTYNNLTAESAEVISAMTRAQDILLVFLAAYRVVARRAKPQAGLLYVFLCALCDLRGEQKQIRKMYQ